MIHDLSFYNMSYNKMYMNERGDIDIKVKNYISSFSQGSVCIVSHDISRDIRKNVVNILKSEYSGYMNNVMWKYGLFGKRFIDIQFGEKSYRVTFKKRKDGHYITYLQLNGNRKRIPSYFQCCNYCRSGLPDDQVKTCSMCYTTYCGRNCQAMDWISYHKFHCPSST